MEPFTGLPGSTGCRQTPLARQNIPGHDGFAAEDLDAEALAVGVAAVT